MDSESATLDNVIMEARWLDADGVEQNRRASLSELAEIINDIEPRDEAVSLFDVDTQGQAEKQSCILVAGARQNAEDIRQRLQPHVDQLRRLAASCAVIFALLMVLGCRGPVGPQGDVGPQGNVGAQGEPGPMNGDVIRVSGRLDTDGFAGFTILENEDTSWPERMPLVNVWLRETSSDAYARMSVFGGMVVVVPNPDSMREILIGFGVKGFAGWEYLVVIVFYEETEIRSATS